MGTFTNEGPLPPYIVSNSVITLVSFDIIFLDRLVLHPLTNKSKMAKVFGELYAHV